LLWVCVWLGGPDAAARAAAKKLADEFLLETGLKPGMTRLIAGALKYTQYDWLKRTIMRTIARQAGGDTDTSQDHEYTDWDDVARFVDEYVAAAQIDGRKAA
jgi:menaquinone-dependent protoporphyrinogen oxidase